MYQLPNTQLRVPPNIPFQIECEGSGAASPVLFLPLAAAESMTLATIKVATVVRYDIYYEHLQAVEGCYVIDRRVCLRGLRE